MIRQNIRYLQNDTADEGGLQVIVETPSGRLPIEDAEVAISYTGVPESTRRWSTVWNPRSSSLMRNIRFR